MWLPILAVFGFAGAAAFLDSTEFISGGEARGRKPSDFDPRELWMGTKVEMEHVRGGRYSRAKKRAIAQEIAMDHLAEDPKYYTKLARIHQD